MPDNYKSTTEDGLNFDSFPFKLFQKAKQFGIWNPAEIDFTKDKEDWQKLTDLEKGVILHLTSLFSAGEESVTKEILPLIKVISDEGRIEEEMYLTSFLFEEAKHTEFFSIFLKEVAENNTDLTHFHSESYKAIFYNALPAAMEMLMKDPSAESQVNASVTYNIIVEGVLAETGYHAYFTMLDENNIMPGLKKGIGLLKRDESRHIAYGVYLLSRLVKENSSLYLEAERKMNELLPLAVNVINDIFSRYEKMPFGLEIDQFVNFAMDQFGKRLEKIEKSRQSDLTDEDLLLGPDS